MNQSKIEELAIRYDTLRDAVAALTRLSEECFGQRDGILRARDAVRRMATTTKRRETAARKQRAEEQRGSEAKAKAFGY
jgi:hypothetical protein